jgi:hypothetical protein
VDSVEEQLLRELASAGPLRTEEVALRLNARHWTELCTALDRLVSSGCATVVGRWGGRKPATASMHAAAPHSAPIRDHGQAPTRTLYSNRFSSRTRSKPCHPPQAINRYKTAKNPNGTFETKLSNCSSLDFSSGLNGVFGETPRPWGQCKSADPNRLQVLSPVSTRAARTPQP